MHHQVSKKYINGLEDKEEDELSTPIDSSVFSYFAWSKGDPDYTPTIKERAALKKLVQAGFTFENILEGIDEAFKRSSPPRYFTHCAAIARDLLQQKQETRSPENHPPFSRKPEALDGTGPLKRSDEYRFEPDLYQGDQGLSKQRT